jgi:hypothetical protein
MNFFSDAKTWKLDISFLFFIYLFSGGGIRHTHAPNYAAELLEERDMTPEAASLIFPWLVKDAATKISNSIKDYCKGNCDLVPKTGNFTGKSLRRGGLQEIFIRTGSKVAGVFRGGWWNFELEQTYTEYLSGCYELLTIGGLALSGWNSGVKSVYLPSCDPIMENLNEQDLTMFEFLVDECFLKSQVKLDELGLRCFKYLCFATFIRFLLDFQRDCPSHFIIKDFYETCASFGFEKYQVNGWVRLVGKSNYQ